MGIALKYLVLAHYKNESDIDGVPCVVCLRSADKPSNLVWVYIDESSESILGSHDHLRDWSGEFFGALRQLPELDARSQEEQVSAFEKLCIGPIRAMRSGVLKMPAPPDEALEFQRALKLVEI